MKRILFVVHRYAPYPGGSENHTQDIAEEFLRRGFDTWVLSGEHKGDYNGVKVSSDPNIVLQNWDLIVVHGGDVHVQNFVLSNIRLISSPVFYFIIKPSDSDICVQGLKDATFIGCGTPDDWEHVKKHNVLHKSVKTTFCINEERSTGQLGFREKYNIKTEKMFLSCGGFWPHKAFRELDILFRELKLKDTTLVLTGYDDRMNIKPEESEFVRSIFLEDKNDVTSAIKEADLYIMHSFEEGFGLVLLESMLNNTPWASRNIAGGKMLKSFGFVYETDEELKNYLMNFEKVPQSKLDDNREYVLMNHLAKNTVDDICRIINM